MSRAEPSVGPGDGHRDELDPERLRRFTRQLLTDLRALEAMLESARFETGIRRIGAEQELFLVDAHGRPAPIALEVIAAAADDHFTTELARFNLEFNLDPLELRGDCFARLEQQSLDLLETARRAAAGAGGRAVLCGILPTIAPSDLTLESMTPRPRYRALDEALRRLRGESFTFRIRGVDELLVRHDSVMLEACNTSFQVHLQVDPADFAGAYNTALALAGPTLAAAANSPLLFGRQLWRETRIALFEQSVDTRSADSPYRQQDGRVSFGRGWVDSSVVEIFREDIARYRVLLAAEAEEDPFVVLGRGEAPKLGALRLHNGTVYRWMRPCYGILDGRPHLRIENRILPAGPSVPDEIANAALWLGLMVALPTHLGDPRRLMRFRTAQENFLAAAQNGLAAMLEWPGCGTIPAERLLLDHLLPLAEVGLRGFAVDPADIDRYLGIVRRRLERQRTGALWTIDSFATLLDAGRNRTEALGDIVENLVVRQQEGLPVSEWPLATPNEATMETVPTVAQIMTTDLFTVGEDELLDLVAAMMEWRHIRNVPVEDSNHHLVGLVTHRTLLRVLIEGHTDPNAMRTREIPVREVMERHVPTTTPGTSALDALGEMRRREVACLPVVEGERLVGIVSERDFLRLTEGFLRRAPQAHPTASP